MNRNRIKALGLMAVTAATAALVWSLGPLPQDPAYHLFADRRELLGIPNFWNLISNTALVLSGTAGLGWLGRARLRPGLPAGVFFTGVVLAGLGSGCYHLAPDNAGLLWDRLGMAVAFAGFLSVLAGSCIGETLGRRLAAPLALLGVASVLYWYAGELGGRGDLRPYALLQFGPLALAPLVLLLYPAPRGFRPWIAGALACYGLAKLCELADGPIFALGHWLSGHTLKHLWAGAATLCTLQALRRAHARHSATAADPV